MQKSVSAAQIDEGTEICQILNHTGTNIADSQLSEELVMLLLLCCRHQLLAIADDSSLLRVELSDDELNVLTLILCQVSLKGI